MKTCIVLSDTHGNTKALGDLDGIFSENDYIIHLGDTSSDGSVIRKRYPAKTTLLNGNCDLYSKFGEDECVICVEGVKIFACHGHNYSVKTTLARLASRAKELGCDIALYGHARSARGLNRRRHAFEPRFAFAVRRKELFISRCQRR